MASSLHYSESPYLCCGVGLTCAGEAEPLWGYCAVTGKVKNRSVLRTGCEPVNITANGPGTSFGFNAENFLTTAGASTYTVDAQGRPTKKTVSGTTTNYFYSSSVVISEQQGSTWTDYIFFGNQRIAKQTGSTSTTATYLHADHLGSTRRCSDSNGNSNGSCDYEPFGECQPSSSCSSLPTNYRFAGMEFDAESALYHTLFRQYDPNQGRWTGVDALPGSSDAPQSLNRYTYAGNDSVNLTDPSGLCTVSFDYSYYLYGYISGGIFHVVGGWIEITNFRTDCGTQRLGAGRGGDRGGTPQWKPKNLDLKNACEAMAAFADQLAKKFSAPTDFARAFGNAIAGVGGPAGTFRNRGMTSLGNTNYTPTMFGVGPHLTGDPVQDAAARSYPGAFRPEFRDSLSGNQDQSHHFAAFLEIGVLKSPSFAWDLAVAIDARPHNQV